MGHTASRGRVKKEKPVNLGRKGEATIEHFESRLEQYSASMATHTPCRGRVKKEKPVGLGRKGGSND